MQSECSRKTILGLNIYYTFIQAWKKIMNNCRPISITNTIIKLSGKYIKHTLTEFLNKYKIINSFQFGFLATN